MDDKTRFVFRRVASSIKDERHDTGAAWKRLDKRISMKREQIVGRQVMRYVAVLVLGTITGYVAWLQAGKEKPAEIISAMNQPRVELILDDGKRILLDHSRDEIIINERGLSIARDSAVVSCREAVIPVTERGEKTEYFQLKIPKGGEYSFRLPDGTVVWINSESTFRFPATFSPGERVVYLEGEAYFEVTPDTTAPFRVCCDRQEIVVLGTSFNVSAYPGETWHTMLAKGSVIIRSGMSGTRLVPGERCSINAATGAMEVTRVNPDDYTSWREGRIVFKDCSLEEIVTRLSRWYDFTVFYQNESLKAMRFRGVIDKNRSLEETLRNLEVTTSIRFEIKGNTVTIQKTG